MSGSAHVKRAAVVVCLIGAAFSALGFRLVHLQVVRRRSCAPR